jgi:hypothetical protein
MNRQRVLLGALAVLLLGLGVTLFSGGHGFFAAPDFNASVTLPAPTTTTNTPPSTQPKKPDPVELLCKGKPGNPVIYYANDPSAAQYNNFGKPLDPRLSPLDEPYDPKPDVHQIVTTSWDRLCHDPTLTRAVVAAAFPSWSGLHGTFDWLAALNKLSSLDWDHAQMVYYNDPPTRWTMMMKHGKNVSDAPTTYITRSHHAGWYLRIAVDSSHTLLLRSGCGDQPSLDLREGTQQASLAGIFPTT